MFRIDLDSDELAEAYRRASPLLFASGRTLVHALELAPGSRVLDVGCGTGLLAEYAARIVGPAGSVVGIDPLPLRVAIAQRRERPNLRFHVGSVFDLRTFPPDSFDAAYLHLVFHWLPEKIEPLRQLHRVLKIGAPLGLTTSARGHENTFETAREAVLSRPSYNAYRDGDATRSWPVTGAELGALLREAGFHITQLDTEPTLAEWPDADRALAFAETISAGNLFGHLPDALRRSARQDVAALLEQGRAGEAIRIEGARLFAVARREGTSIISGSEDHEPRSATARNGG